MSDLHSIKKRIDSIGDTRKITNAMYLISSAKMRKAKADLDRTRPYFEATKSEIKRIFRTGELPESRYLYPIDENEKITGTYACLVITGDKGLAGSYNYNVIKKTQKLVEQQGSDIKWYVVGEYGRRYFAQHGIPVEQSFLYTAQNPTIGRAREICDILLEGYTSGALKKIYVAYTDMRGMTDEAQLTRLIPFHRNQFAENMAVEKPVTSPFEYSPSPEVVLESIMPGYLSGFIYSALVDSFCSEQHARMVAMKAANDSAEELISTLKIQYNRLRQAAITQEITEIAAGARARGVQQGEQL